MPRGGTRKGAGRPSTWASGCSFKDTKLIRVPNAIFDQVLELAHRLDKGEEIKGEEIDLDTKSIKEENQGLKHKLVKCNLEMEKLRAINQEAQQLSLNYDSFPILPDEKDLHQMRDKALATLKVGLQSSIYKKSRKVVDIFIKYLTKSLFD